MGQTKLPCQMRLPVPAGLRPAWYATGVPTVSDPVYGDLILVPAPRPLRCYKTAIQADGTAWMWLGGPWYGSARSPLSGMLFFAPSWERWQLLQYVSRDDNAGTSVWQGVPGCGRVLGRQVTITAQP